MLFLYIAVISCTSLNTISNGMVAYSPDSLDFGTTATYTCLEGYFLEGTSTRTCIGDGSGISGNWNGVAPVCSGESSAIVIHRMQDILFEEYKFEHLSQSHSPLFFPLRQIDYYLLNKFFSA